MSDAKPYTLAEATDLDDFDGGPEWKGTVYASEPRIVATVEALERAEAALREATEELLETRNERDHFQSALQSSEAALAAATRQR